MAFIDFLGNLPTYDGQMKEPIIIHGQKTSIFQNAYRMADTRFAKAHVPGKVMERTMPIFFCRTRIASR